MKDTMKGMYISYANGLGMGDFTKVKTGADRSKLINTIADGYCLATDNKDETKRSQYISALMLLFWGEIGKMAEKCKAVPEYEYDDFAAKLYECIEVACKYKAWKDGKHTAEACIRSAIASRGAAAILYESNLDKNKANINTTSLDADINDDDGHETSRLDLLEDDTSENISSSIAVKILIQGIIDKGDIISGIILDNIAFNDCTKDTKKTNSYIDSETGKTYKYSTATTEFSEHYLVQALSSLPDTYKNYFMDSYSAKEEAVDAALNRIKAINSTKLHKFIKATLTKQRAVMSA